jgi:4-hydroxy-tetrahydrodipicolinate reductase
LITVGVLGADGRMGRLVARLLGDEFADKARLDGAVDLGGNPADLLRTDVAIDFSSPEAMLTLARAAMSAPGSLPAFVIGSTGWKIDQRREIEELAKLTPVMMSSNFSTGVLAVLEILKAASPMLSRLGYTPTIVETHHRHKKDAPSGTAISFQRAIAPAGPGNVQTYSVRAGEVVGDHEVTFYGAGDQITFGHFAQDRQIFARGAVEAALWLAGRRQTPGLVGIDAYFKERYLT